MLQSQYSGAAIVTQYPVNSWSEDLEILFRKRHPPDESKHFEISVRGVNESVFYDIQEID